MLNMWSMLVFQVSVSNTSSISFTNRNFSRKVFCTKNCRRVMSNNFFQCPSGGCWESIKRRPAEFDRSIRVRFMNWFISSFLFILTIHCKVTRADGMSLKSKKDNFLAQLLFFSRLHILTTWEHIFDSIQSIKIESARECITKNCRRSIDAHW